MRERTAIIGDIGGHLDVFVEALAAAGVDVENRHIPEGLFVVQVGDLVHKGPDSDRCVKLADHLLRSNVHRYVQLIGNHEAHYLGGPDLAGRRGVTPVAESTAATLHRWWRDGSASLAVAVRQPSDGQPGRDLLVTHGGLTRGLWLQLGRPAPAVDAAVAINQLRDDPAEAFRPGWLVTGTVDHAAGVTSPRTGSELAASWLAGSAPQMPFDQVHGHEGVWWWPENRFHDDVPAAVRALSAVDHERRFCSVAVPGGTLLSVDWVLGERAHARDWTPLVLDGAVAS